MQMSKNNDFNEKIDEFVDSEGGIIDGGRNVTNNSEIETGPVKKPFNDDSDYEKGISTTTDRASRYRQDIPWFAVYSYGARSSKGPSLSERKIFKKKEIEDEITEDLVKKSKKDGDVWNKDYDYKIEKIIDSIEDIDNTTQLEKIKKAILNKLQNA